MSLILKVISSKNQALQATLEHEFTESGGTVGRKSSNTWVLPDEQRHLSGSHAKIEYADDCFYIIDTSTNGVFVNGESKPLGNGNKKQLEDGFQLLMGTYIIQVSISNNEIIESQVSNDETDISDDLFSDLFDDSKQSFDNQKIEPLNQIEQIEKTSSNSKSIGSDDPFFDFDEFTSDEKPKNDDANHQSGADKRQSELDSFFKPAKIRQVAETPSSPDEDIVEAIDEDTDEVIDGSYGSSKNTEESESKSIGGIPDDWNKIEKKGSFDDLLEGIGEPLDAEEHLKKVIKEDVVATKAEAPVKPKAKSKSNASTEPRPSSAFLKGLGISEQKLKGEFSEQNLFLAGKLLRSAIQGTMEVLRSRAEIKNEMRMDMTTIQPIQNNPIKFAIDIDEAIYKLLIQDNKSYMDPEKAMEEAYDDIASHQLAIISGIQASLSHVLKRFEPENLISRLEKKNPISASIPIHRQAKLWEAFEDLYDDIETEAEDDFNRLFGQEFAKAYDEQIEILKKKRVK